MGQCRLAPPFRTSLSPQASRMLVRFAWFTREITVTAMARAPAAGVTDHVDHAAVIPARWDLPYFACGSDYCRHPPPLCESHRLISAGTTKPMVLGDALAADVSAVIDPCRCFGGRVGTLGLIFSSRGRPTRSNASADLNALQTRALTAATLRAFRAANEPVSHSSSASCVSLTRSQRCSHTVGSFRENRVRTNIRGQPFPVRQGGRSLLHRRNVACVMMSGLKGDGVGLEIPSTLRSH